MTTEKLYELNNMQQELLMLESDLKTEWLDEMDEDMNVDLYYEHTCFGSVKVKLLKEYIKVAQEESRKRYFELKEKWDAL